jgi:prepilin-type N-terminal cleavage/methylation domain-containing protein
MSTDLPTGPPWIKFRCCFGTQRQGFTLTEIMVVIAIVGVMAAMSVLSFVKMRHDSSVARFVSTARLLRGAFQEYATITRGYPGTTATGVLPVGMASYLPSGFDFTADTPLGGKWRWRVPVYSVCQFGLSVRGGLSGSAPLADEALFAQVDAQLDDGELTTGQFRKVMTDRYVWIIQVNDNEPWGVKP